MRENEAIQAKENKTSVIKGSTYGFDVNSEAEQRTLSTSTLNKPLEK